MEQVITSRPALLASEGKWRTRHASLPVVLAAMGGDTLILFLALLFASWLRFETTLAHLGISAPGLRSTDYLGQAVYGTLLFMLLLPHRKIYDLHRMLRLRQIVPVIVKTALIWLLAFMALCWLLRVEREVSRVYVVLACFLTTGGLILWRAGLRQVMASEIIAPRVRQRILFVGWSAQAASLARAIGSDRCHPYEIAGYVPFGPAEGAMRPSVPINQLGYADGISSLLQDREIDMVVVADLQPATEEMLRLASLCEKEMVDFKVIPDCFEILVSCLELQTVSGVPVLGVSHLPLDYPFNVIAKHVVDAVGAIAGAVLSAPIILLFGLLVYWEDPGPIIYRQRRLGARRPPLLDAQGPQHEGERGKGRQGRLDGEGRPAAPARRRVHAPVEARRTPAVLERAAGRDEPGGPPARASGTDPDLQRGDSAL